MRVVAEARKAARRRRDPLLHGRRMAQPEGCATWKPSCAMVEGVKALGMETCMTLGMLDSGQAARLGEPV